MDIDPFQWPAFSRLIDAMLDQPEARREAWVRALTGEDAALAPKLLELLKPTGRTRTSSWFDTLPKLSGAESGAGPDASQLLEQAGDQIGPYLLVRLLGTGGMGSVWYAERSDQLKRRAVALKLPLSVASRTLAARFEREREILAGLVHPNIARLYDAGISSTGRAYLALEYVEGQSLDKFCDGRRLDLDARVDLFQQVLAAVQYAHSRLVIHRDIKPSNILVTPEGQVRLLDFGVAKLLDSDKADATELTQLGGAGMTLAYAAPEQIAGQAVSTATDVYALGVVLYELLTGARPYRLERDTRGALEEAILKGDIPLPSALGTSAEVWTARSTTATQLQRELRGDLDAILLKALQREPAQRYATVAALAEDLARFRAGLVVQAHRPSRGYQIRKFVVRNRLVVGSASAAALALLLGAGVAIWQAREAQHQERIAIRERDSALSAAAHREAVDEFLSDLLIEAGRNGEPISVLSLVRRADAISAKEFSGNPEARAAVLRTLGQFETEFQNFEGALKYLNEAQKLLQGSPDALLSADVACSRAMLLGASGHSVDAEAIFKEFLTDPHAPADARAECLGNRAWFKLYIGDGAGAAPLIDEAIGQLKRSGRTSEMKELRLLTARGMVLGQMGQPAGADVVYVQVLDRLRELGRDRGELASAIRLERIAAAIDSGDFDLALDVAEESVRAERVEFPGRMPLQQLYERAAVLAYMERYSDALEALNQIASAAATSNATLRRRAELDAAEILSKLKCTGEAEARFRDAIRDSSTGTEDDATTRTVLVTRARIDLNCGRFKDALATFSRVEKITDATDVTMTRVNIDRAMAETKLGETDAALKYARVAIESGKKQRGDRARSIWVGLAQFQLGIALEQRGERKSAIEAFRESINQLKDPNGKPEHPAQGRAQAALRRLEKSLVESSG